MSRIIDLKNNISEKLKPEDGRVSVIKNSQVNPKKQNVVSWSGELYRQPDIKILVVVSVILFLIAALVQIFQKNLITTVFFALLGVVLLLNANRKSKNWNFEISPLGLKVGEKLYGLREIKSFWIEYEPSLGIKELSLHLKKWYLPYLKIPIDNQNPVQIRSALIEFVPEIEHQDTFVEILARKLGL